MKKIPPIELVLILFMLIITLSLPGLGVLFAFLALFIYLSIRNRKENFKSVGFKKPQSWTGLLIVTFIFGIVISLSFQSIIEPVIEKLLGSKLDLSNLDNIKGNVLNYIIMLAIGWVVGGFLEEVLFRGFLITRISALFKNAKIGNILAVLITSIVFGLSHMYQGFVGVISTGLISVILGIVFVKSKKVLWYSIFIHGFNNTLGITIIYLNLEKSISGFFY